MGGGRIGIKFESAFEFGFRPRPIPLVGFANKSKRNVGLRQAVINLERLCGSRLGVLANLVRGHVPRISEERVGIGKARIGQSVMWISINGLLEEINSLGESNFCPFVLIIKTLQIELISFGFV